MENRDIRNAGLKVTMPRVRILEVLEANSDRHLSAEELHRLLQEGGDEIGLATIYRVLTQFEEAGLVKRQNFEGGYCVFELDQGGHHDHIVCIGCGKVVEFMDETIELRQREIARRMGYEIDDHKLVIYGRCRDPRCRGRGAAQEGPSS